MRFALLVFLVLATSCVVPVEIPHPTMEDAGVGPVDAGVGPIDAGHDAGVITRTCSVPESLGMFVARRTSSFVFAGCADATFTADPEVTVEVTPNGDGSATVRLTPSALGAWLLTIGANGLTTTRELLTDERFDLDAGYVVHFRDRVDSSSRTVTPSGRLVTSQTFGTFNVYDPDGGLEQSIPSFGWPVALSGDAVYLTQPSGTVVERWLDTPTGLVSTGTIDVTGSSFCMLCRVEDDRVVSALGYDLVEFTWDAGTVSRQVLTSGLELPMTFDLLLHEGPDKVWADNFCSYEPGCTSTVCPAIETCIPPRNGSRLVAATSTRALVYNGSGGIIQLWSLPLSSGQKLHERGGASMRSFPGRDAPVVLGSIEYVIHRDRLLMREFGVPGDDLIVTRHWVVHYVTPRELRFIRR